MRIVETSDRLSLSHVYEVTLA